MRIRRPLPRIAALPAGAALCLSLVAACTGDPASDPAPVAPEAAVVPRTTAENTSAGPPTVPSDNASEALHDVVEGVFSGTLPCDGCEDTLVLDATLHLRADGGFDLVERHTDGEATIEHAGVWYASDDGRAILLADDHGHGHRVFEWHGEDALRLLPDAPMDDAEPVLLVRAD